MTTPAPHTLGAVAYAAVMGRAGGRQETTLRGDGRDGVLVGLYQSPPYDVQVPPLAVSRLSVNLTASPVHGGLADERRVAYDARALSLFHTPADASARWRKLRPSRHLNLYFPAGAFGLPPAQPLWNTQVPGLRPWVDQLVAELAAPSPFADEAADSLARLLLIRVARQTRERAGALTPERLARVREYIASALDQRLLVADLARVAGLSPNRFTRACVQATGLSPHRLVLAARVDRAVDLLAHSRRPLSEVAATCGFASQQHMTAVLRRAVGHTPGALRSAAGMPPH